MQLGSNPYFADFVDNLSNRFSDDASSMSMSEWVSANTRLKRKPFSFKGHEFQRRIMDDMHTSLCCIKCSQVGLALALDTPVPTLNGWTSMAQVKVGDTLFDESGRPCSVTYVSPVYQDRECYRVVFDDGESIVADAEHRWYVESHRTFTDDGPYSVKGRPHLGLNLRRKGVVTTEFLSRFHKRGRLNPFAVPTTAPLDCAEAALPIDPYFLGLWLGDGNLHAPIVTAHKDDAVHYIEELSRRGMVTELSSETETCVQLRVNPHNYKRGHDTMHQRLNEMGLLKTQKSIPVEYLRSSISQRLSLLQGLLDTDGSITKKGRVSFYNNSPLLVSDFNDLVRSLGFKPRTRWRPASPSRMKSGHVIQPKHPVAEVGFVAYREDGVFSLPRKRERLVAKGSARPSESLRRRVVSVEKVSSVPVRCLTVDSPSHLFLAGWGMIPTHNTEIQIRKMLAFMKRELAVNVIFTLPNLPMRDRLSTTRVLPLVNSEKVFNALASERPLRNKAQIQVDQSFAYLTGSTEGEATSIPADMILNDEVDLTDQAMLGLFQSRLQHSSYKIQQAFSTPTFTGFGIDRMFENSDQFEYMYRCPGCNHWQVPQFLPRFLRFSGEKPRFECETVDEIADLTENDLDPYISASGRVVCEKCEAPMDLSDPALREWVPKFPTRARRGYRVRPFSVGTISPSYILTQLVNYKQAGNLKGWYNTTLGEPFNDSSVRLSEADIRACLRGGTEVGPAPMEPLFLGIDAGQTCHIVMGTPLKVLRWWTVPHTQLQARVSAICQDYGITFGSMDRHPYTPLAASVMEATAGKIVPCVYSTSANSPVYMEKTDELGQLTHYTINRTMALDSVAERVRNRAFNFLGYTTQEEDIVTHLRGMIRVEVAEAPPLWQKLSDSKTADHYFHALALMMTAAHIYGRRHLLDDRDLRSGLILQAAQMDGMSGTTLGLVKARLGAGYSPIARF